MLLTFVYNMNSCFYRQPTSWHGGWLQLHRLQCMNWKLKTQIQSKNCWTSCYITTTISIHRLQSMTWRFRLQIHSQGDAFVSNMNFMLVQEANKLAWRLATAAWVAKHEPKIEDTHIQPKKCCFQLLLHHYNCHHTQVAKHCLKIQDVDSVRRCCLLLIRIWTSACTGSQQVGMARDYNCGSNTYNFVRLSLWYNHRTFLFISTWIQERSRRRTGALHT